MKGTTMRSLSDLYLHDLREAYHASQQLLRAMPKMLSLANNQHLCDAFLGEAETVRVQIRRLEAVFFALGQSSHGVRCEGMEGLVASALAVGDTDGEADVLDAALLTAGQKIAHFQIATYGSLRSYARLLRRFDDASLMCESLGEEKRTDEILTRIADGFVNTRALG